MVTSIIEAGESIPNKLTIYKIGEFGILKKLNFLNTIWLNYQYTVDIGQDKL